MIDNNLFEDYRYSIFPNNNNNKKKKKGKLKNKIRDFIMRKKFRRTVTVLVFVFVCILVGKSFYYKSMFKTIRSREDEEARVVVDDSFDSSSLKNSAVSEYINCISEPIDKNNLSDGIKNSIKKINNYYGSSRNYFAFKYVDLFTGFSVSYNENQKIFGASTIKAPTDLYIWEMASQGKVNLDEKLKYTVRYYNIGSGKLKNGKFNVNYTIRELLGYSTIDSDNAAHNMLMDRYGRKNMLKFWQEKGTKAIFTQGNNWGPTSAHDAAIFMTELYRFYNEDKEYGEAVMNNFIKSHPKFLSNSGGYKMASKPGWAGSSIHDIAIVFADNPYIVVALSNLGGQAYKPYFNKVSELAYELHTEYWKYKMELCGDIKQY